MCSATCARRGSCSTRPAPSCCSTPARTSRCRWRSRRRKLAPHGELGRYLHEYRLTDPGFQKPTKGFFDLGDIAALADPDLACWEETDCPEVRWDLVYEFTGRMGRILRCYHVDRDRTFQLLFDRMAAA